MKPFTYLSPTSMEEALGLLQQEENRDAQWFAGGTDLLPLMKMTLVNPSSLINIKRLADLPDSIEETPQGLSIGALTSLSTLETHPLIRQHYPLLAEAAAVAATPQLRNMATLGGNVLQRPRCWYFRNPHLSCWLKGGDTCPAYQGENHLHAIYGGGPCYAVHPSDIAPTLLALHAEVVLQGSQGERLVPLADFFALPITERRTETQRQHDELLLAIRLPALPEGTGSTYLKAMDRKVWAFALVGVAAIMRLDHANRRQIQDVRLVLSGVAPIPWRLTVAEEQLRGAEASDAAFQHAAEAALDEAMALQHNAYKIPLARTLIQRALSSLLEKATNP